MFFVSFIIFIIISVCTVQPIYGDANANALHPQTEVKMFSDSGTVITLDKHTPSSLNKSVAKPLATPTNKIERHRGIKKTDDAPSITELESNNNKNKISSDKTPAIVDTEHAIAKATANHSQNPSQSNSEVEQKPAISKAMPNTQIDIGKSKILAPSLDPPKTTASTTTTTTSSTSTTTTTTTTPKPTSTTTTTTKTTITTTTKPPTKPTLTISVEDDPALLNKAAETQSQSQSSKDPTAEEVRDNGPLSLQLSETISYSDQKKSSHNVVMSIIGVIVVIPFLVLITNCAVRRARDYWSKRRYRRMDYLIEDMYN